MNNLSKYLAIGFLLWMSACVENQPETDPFDPIEAENNFNQSQKVLTAMLKDLNTNFQSMGLDEALQVAAEYMRSQEIVDNVIYDMQDGNVTFVARFKDGKLFFMPVASGELADRTPKYSSPGSQGIPSGSAMFIDLSTDLSSWTKEAHALAQEYGFEDSVYGNETTGHGGVDFFENITNHSIVYLSGHGAFITEYGIDTGAFNDQ